MTTQDSDHRTHLGVPLEAWKIGVVIWAVALGFGVIGYVFVQNTLFVNEPEWRWGYIIGFGAACTASVTAQRIKRRWMKNHV